MDDSVMTPAQRTFQGTDGGTIFVRLAAMGEVVVHVDQVAVALPPEEAAKLGRMIIRLSTPEEEGGDQ
ncbi:hypothetical protein [Streptomyces sp. LS1784]|uniref:hypothetical protein n=1 Tax=Streptomyces sp. LS1784 TaxID=2851533 RepID=UPI001CCAE4AE|nr:hypothetical protein [Streptomyces sp. LS1784]